MDLTAIPVAKHLDRLDALMSVDGRRIVDVGCGDGTVARARAPVVAEHRASLADNFVAAAETGADGDRFYQPARINLFGKSGPVAAEFGLNVSVHKYQFACLNTCRYGARLETTPITCRFININNHG